MDRDVDLRALLDTLDPKSRDDLRFREMLGSASERHMTGNAG
jgi:hypothetical protein